MAKHRKNLDFIIATCLSGVLMVIVLISAYLAMSSQPIPPLLEFVAGVAVGALATRFEHA